MDLFDLVWLNAALPKDLARAPIDTYGGESFVCAIEFG
jgi:hypothetical protein